ncbi:calcium-binding protein [Grimontia kaedaensis]|uniref:Calcium-binding protein n=1 Tax=Grimontia kaedaensis TaxID=2872157 RepID=A0ABY4WPZ4_9GAMM|nr:calcium-binding protein [Grimontia kaedaensis]USH01631.1 calcium-binding protein [Grimontia kaedaensis]
MASISGDNTNNNLVGTTDDDQIYGLLGNDTLRGYEGNDAVYGDSSESEITALSPDTDGYYSLQEETLVTVTLSQFNFSTVEEKSLGYAILDASGEVISRDIIVDYVSLAERGSAVDINVPGGAKLVFFTMPSTELFGFEWRPFDLNDVDTNISSSDVTIAVEEIDSDTSTHGNDNLYGYEGDDRLYGEGGNDFLVGADGNDIISGGDGNDTLWGGNDDDHLHGGNGNDILQGQNGTDKLEGGSGDDTLYGGRGDDTILAGGDNDLVFGQDGDDYIRGGSGNDEIWGDAGNDTIRGDQGDDYINGDDGEDLIFGGSGDDEIYGAADDDDLRGNAGNDTIYGEDGNDFLRGNGGNDYLDGGDGDDTVYGNIGSNTLLGGKGNDYIFAGWGSFDNLLDGQEGEDLLNGGTNTDTLIFDLDDFQGQTLTLPSDRVINKHIYDAATGFDVLKISGSVHADFTGEAYQTMPGVTGNIIAGIEAAIGDAGDQTVTINIHEIDAQSDTTTRDDWQGFVAWLGEGDDTLNLTGVQWQYEAAGTSNADITPAMLEKMGLTATQAADLQAYVFTDIRDGDQVTIWTDAENITYLGTDIV